MIELHSIPKTGAGEERAIVCRSFSSIGTLHYMHASCVAIMASWRWAWTLGLGWAGCARSGYTADVKWRFCFYNLQIHTIPYAWLEFQHSALARMRLSDTCTVAMHDAVKRESSMATPCPGALVCPLAMARHLVVVLPRRLGHWLVRLDHWGHRPFLVPSDGNSGRRVLVSRRIV